MIDVPTVLENWQPRRVYQSNRIHITVSLHGIKVKHGESTNVIYDLKLDILSG